MHGNGVSDEEQGKLIMILIEEILDDNILLEYNDTIILSINISKNYQFLSSLDYHIVKSDSSQTCPTRFKLDSRKMKDKDDCQDLCNENYECKYFFHAPANQRCLLYSNCYGYVRQEMRGSIYEKIYEGM